MERKTILERAHHDDVRRVSVFIACNTGLALLITTLLSSVSDFALTVEKLPPAVISWEEFVAR